MAPLHCLAGKFAGIVTMPGLFGNQSNFGWLGPRLASHGFVVMNVDTPLLVELDFIRKEYAKSALEQLVQLGNTPGNPLYGKIDGQRLGAIGHSAGAGGVIQLGRDYPGLAKAVIPLAPNMQDNVQAMPPMMLMVCDGDPAVPAETNALPVYNAAVGAKQFVLAKSSVADAHNCQTANNANTKLGKYIVSWMKRWLDQDTRYNRFLCGDMAPSRDTDYVLDWRSNCPY